MASIRSLACAVLGLLLASGCGPSEREQKAVAALRAIEAETAKLAELKEALRQAYARVEVDQAEVRAWVKQRGDELTKTYPPGDEKKAKFAELLAEEQRKVAEHMKRNAAERSRIRKEIQAQTERIKAAEAAHVAALAGK